MNTKLGTESETGIAPKESGSEFRTLLRHDYLISSHSMTSSFLLRVLLLNLPCSSQSGQRYSSHIAIRINILLHLSIHSVTWLCGRGPDWLRHGSTAGKDVSVSFFFFPFPVKSHYRLFILSGRASTGMTVMHCILKYRVSKKVHLYAIYWNTAKYQYRATTSK